MAVGEFINHLIIDSAAFGLPLLYDLQLPNQWLGELTMCFPHRIRWAYDSPEPKFPSRFKVIINMIIPKSKPKNQRLPVFLIPIS